MRKFQWSFALAAMILFAGGWGAPKNNDADRAARVSVMQPKEMEFVQKILVQGNVETKEKVEISSRVSGTIDFMGPGEGDMVKKGDTLFQVDRVKLENDVKGQKHKLSVAEAELKIAEINGDLARKVAEKAQSDFNRSEQLRKAKAVSEDAHERTLLSLREAEAGVLKADAQTNYARAKVGQAQAELEIAEKNLADSRSRTPIDGKVVTKKKDPGEFVNTGEILYRIEDPDRLEVVTMISAVYYDLVEAGHTPVRFMLDGVDKGRAVVTYKAPSIDPESRTFKLKMLVPPEVKLVSGTLCDISIILEEKEAYGLPADALLLRANDRYIVYAIGPDNRAKSFDVVRGIVDGKYCEVLNATELLKERFVVTGQTFVNNGSLLREIKTKQ